MSIAEPTPEQLEKAAYLSIDPGETTGYALFDKEGAVVVFGQLLTKTTAEQTQFFNYVVPHVRQVIAEDYKNHGFTQQKRWSRNQTSKNIGGVETICELHGVPIYLQANTVKSIGYKWAGMEGPPSNHSISHQYDAYVHGVYWLVVNNLRIPAQPKD